ncbi:unnamed protein product, partial [Lymnaea stagnalis]
YSIAKRIVIVQSYVLTGSIKETQEIFAAKFLAAGVPAKCAIQQLMKKWRTTRSVGTPKRIWSRPSAHLRRSPMFLHGWREALPSLHVSCLSTRTFCAPLASAFYTTAEGNRTKCHVCKN